VDSSTSSSHDELEGKMGPLPQRRGGALGFAPLASGIWEREKERKCGAQKCLYALVFWGVPNYV
jgi:hypothetical protein